MAGVSMGDCVHIAGVLNFLGLAESLGYETEFLGPARSPEEISAWVQDNRPDILAVGYRLDPDAAGRLIDRLMTALERTGVRPIPRLVFGGTPPVARVAEASGVFERVFSGLEDIDEIIAYLKGSSEAPGETGYPDTLVERIEWKAPYPLLRHHFGLSSVKATRAGIERISEARVLDVISIGPDQNAQESFFHPKDMDPDQAGSGGVPVRSSEDFELLYSAAQRGNYPLMRCYSGTRDIIRFAEMLQATIRNVWAAIPLCWYNVLDGRGPRGVGQSIEEALAAMAWHAVRGIPVEVNESHHWSLRDAPDVVAVAAAYLAALSAKRMGVKDYVAQFMFNTPPGTSAAMDLGKMLAKLELIESLVDHDFRVWRQVRAGLSSFPVDLGLAKGQLATSTLVSMNLKPHIVHVVGFCEGDHAATSEDVIESCKIARGVIRNCMHGMPDMTLSEEVQARKAQLLQETRALLEAIARLPELLPGLLDSKPGQRSCCSDSLVNPKVLAFAIKAGLLDAPHLVENPAACGKIRTSMVNGACMTVDPESGKVLPETERLGRILKTLERKVSA
ncbi:MAG TPA: cobalamin B12-binding domain-containing protein [Firmicutes bacterium]|nr:cobalamin B12-binding domain-containing protein [Bacillota bacterium]